MKKTISIVASCWNEVDNIPELYRRCRETISRHPEYDYIIIDDYDTSDINI